MFCNSLNSARARLARVSVRLGLVWLDSRLGLGSFFSENESLGSASKTNSLGSASKARHHLHPYSAHITPHHSHRTSHTPQVNCPSGLLDRKLFTSLYKAMFPSGTADAFYEHIFRTFDGDGNMYIDFKEFLKVITEVMWSRGIVTLPPTLCLVVIYIYIVYNYIVICKCIVCTVQTYTYKYIYIYIYIYTFIYIKHIRV